MRATDVCLVDDLGGITSENEDGAVGAAVLVGRPESCRLAADAPNRAAA